MFRDAEKPATYFELRRKGMQQLRQSGIEDAKTDSLLLLEQAAGIDLQQYLMKMHDCADSQAAVLYETLIRRRCTHEPLQYIQGTADFMGLTFRVTPDVLIPRQDTETVVETALSLLMPGSSVLDLCTGSGCIIISLAKKADLREAAGSDVSAEALAVAAENAMRLGCPEIDFLQSNLFEEIARRYDMIISNPPYIPSGAIGGLMEEVKDHEPHAALDGGEDGLDFYRKITAQAVKHLNPGGCLIVEIGYDQGETVPALFAQAGFTGIRTIQDLAGNDRAVYGRYAHV